MCIADIFKCKPLLRNIGIYQTYKGRSFIYLFIALPLISTFNGESINDILSTIDSINLYVGIFLLFNSFIFFILSLCKYGHFPKRGIISSFKYKMGDPAELPMGFEEELDEKSDELEMKSSIEMR